MFRSQRSRDAFNILYTLSYILSCLERFEFSPVDRRRLRQTRHYVHRTGDCNSCLIIHNNFYSVPRYDGDINRFRTRSRVFAQYRVLYTAARGPLPPIIIIHIFFKYLNADINNYNIVIQYYIMILLYPNVLSAVPTAACLVISYIGTSVYYYYYYFFCNPFSRAYRGGRAFYWPEIRKLHDAIQSCGVRLGNAL